MPPKGSTKAAAAAAAAAVAQDKDGETLNGSPPPPVNSGPMSAAQKQAAPYMAGLHDFELPKSVIQRLAKGAVSLRSEGERLRSGLAARLVL
jgi:hypothetical protein